MLLPFTYTPWVFLSTTAATHAGAHYLALAPQLRACSAALADDAELAELEDEVTETQAAQIEMDKTAEQFRGLHQDRKKLIAQWDQAPQPTPF